VFVSFDDGDSWQSLQLNLPPASMRDLQVKGADLIVATHGRGFWVIDDITPLRQMDAKTLGADAALLAPADAWLTPVPNEQGTPVPKDEPFADNPPYGAYIDYYLRSAASGPVSIEVLGADGHVVRRVASDDPPVTPDPNALAVQTVWAQSTMPTPAGGGRGVGGRRGGQALAPGGYTVRLTVNGKTFTQPLTVRPDPRGTI
jgi:hypothetical protein